jgi:DNA-binding response OmpR family regulator
MQIIVVLAIGLDSTLLKAQGSLWKAAGYIVNVAGSIRDAIDHFKAGDFDLVLLGDSIPEENRERLTYLIRSLGSHVPVAFIAESSGDCDRFADATLRTEPKAMLTGMRELVARRRPYADPQ